jgi:hypothetical protein
VFSQWDLSDLYHKSSKRQATSRKLGQPLQVVGLQGWSQDIPGIRVYDLVKWVLK